MRNLIAAGLAVALAVAAPVAHAAPERTPTKRAPVPAMADRDRNGISDELQARIDDARPNERFRVVVTHDGPGDAASARRAVGDFKLERSFRIIPGFAGTMTAAQIRGLARRSGVFRIESNAIVRTTLWAASNDFGAAGARAEFGVDGSGVGVCIVDTGVDVAHEQLDTKIVGWKDFVGSGPTPYDDHGHGTHVASTAFGDGAGGPDAPAFIGVSYGADGYAAKVLDAVGSGYESDVIAGVQWCANQPGVDVISMSLGTDAASDGQDAMSQAVNNAVLVSGKTTVVAAGNSGDLPETVGSPGAAEHAITVGAASEHGSWPWMDNYSEGIALAYFSSRGPTIDQRIKPDIVGPGMSITAAMAGSGGGYATYSGTSMATPFVAGLVALALERDPGRTPAQLKADMEGTARDWGAPGKDNEWGAGLVDGIAFVAEAGTPAPYTALAMPTHTYLTGTVAKNGVWDHQFWIGGDGLDVPIAATMILDGTMKCVYRLYGSCWAYEWGPDIDVEILDPNGTQVALSQCALGAECDSGRQESPHAPRPTVTGWYTLRVTPYGGAPNNGRGGSFAIDLSHGPLVAPGPPGNQAPVADAGPDQSVTDADDSGSEDVTLDGSSSTDDAGIVSYEWDEGGVPLASGVSPTVSLGVGVHTLTLTVMDAEGLTDTDDVVVTVSAPAAAGTVHVGDLDGSSGGAKNSWSATVTVLVHDDGDAAAPGVEVNGTWTGGVAATCTTTAAGTCIVTSPSTHKRNGSVTFTVDSLVSADPYSPGDNHDPDGDSNGTSITVLKP